MKTPFLLILFLMNILGYPNSIDIINKEVGGAKPIEKQISLNIKLSKKFFQHNQFDSAIYYNKTAEILAASINPKYPHKHPEIFISRAYYYIQNQRFDLAKDEILKLSKDTSDNPYYSEYDKMVLCEYYSAVEVSFNRPKEAIKSLQKALNIGKNIGVELGNLYHSIGAIFYELSNYRKARSYFELAKDYDDIDSVIVNSSIVLTYIVEKNNEEALKQLKTMVSITDSVTHKNYKWFTLLGGVYVSKENYDLAIPILKASNEFMKKNEVNIYDLVDNNSLLGSAYLMRYEATKDKTFLNYSKQYLKAGISGVKQTNRLASKIDLYFSLAKVLILQGKSEEAINSFEKYREAQDSLYKLETSAKVEELDVKYQVSEKQKKIALLKAEKIKTELQHKKDSNTLVIIISLIIILSLSLLFLYLSSQSKKKNIEQKLQIESLKKHELKSKLKLKEKELNHTIRLISEKNSLINSLKDQTKNNNTNLDYILGKFQQNYISDKEWDSIQLQFDSIHNGLIEKTQKEFGKLTPNDIRLFILMKLNYSNNSMVEILNISYEGVKKAKQRLKKKLLIKSEKLID